MICFTMDGIEYRVFDHLYAVSRCGKVIRQMQPYRPTNHPQGYLVLGRQRLMHRVVAACWNPEFTPDKHVHHINGNKTDNRAENLECLSPKTHLGHRHAETIGKHTVSAEAREKLRQYRSGKKDSAETRAKKTAILAEVYPRRECRFQGVTYPSVSAAARAAGIPVATFRLRCASKNFPEYSLDLASEGLQLLDLS